MRVFTPEVEGWLALFHATYALRSIGGTAHYERVALPEPGGVLDQSARTLDVLEFLGGVHNQIVREVAASAERAQMRRRARRPAPRRGRRRRG